MIIVTNLEVSDDAYYFLKEVESLGGALQLFNPSHSYLIKGSGTIRLAKKECLRLELLRPDKMMLGSESKRAKYIITPLGYDVIRCFISSKIISSEFSEDIKLVLDTHGVNL